MSAPLLVRALRGKNVERVPAWILRQAGRYLPEYRELRAKHSFEECVRDPALAAAITLQPVRRFPLDAAILFSDIMTPVLGMGIRLKFDPGPVLPLPLRTRSQVEALPVPDPARDLAFVAEALRLVRAELPPATALVGFAGSPFTVAAYLVEGGGGKGEFRALRRMAREEPETLDLLLATLARTTGAYLRAQVEAGADAVQIFDTWGGILDPASYARFALGSLKPVLDAVRPLGVPVILYAGAAGPHLAAAAAAGADALAVDHRESLDTLRRRVGTAIALQGNLDPAALFASKEALRAAATSVMRAGGGRGHVFNLGHGIWPETDPDAVAFLLEVVREEGVRAAAGAAR